MRQIFIVSILLGWLFVPQSIQAKEKEYKITVQCVWRGLKTTHGTTLLRQYTAGKNGVTRIETYSDGLTIWLEDGERIEYSPGVPCKFQRRRINVR